MAFRRFKFPEKRSAIAATASSATVDAPAPARFDLRERVAVALSRDQRTCNACSAFAAASVLEIQSALAGHPISVSPGYLHTCLGHEGDSDAASVCATGVDLGAILQGITQRGFLTEPPSAFPFPVAACLTVTTSGKMSRFDPLSPDTAKAFMANRGPIAADMYIWEDFFGYSGSGSYFPDTTRPGPYLHSICVIGYDDQGWIVKNSFGPAWGDGTGCARIGYGATCGLLGSPSATGVERQQFGLTLA